MYVMRPIREEDFEAIHAYAQKAAPGILSLPKKPELLKKKIALSIESFAKNVTKPEGEYYFFVLEDTRTKQVKGCSAVWAQSGFWEPLYCFEQKIETRSSKLVDAVREHEVLYPKELVKGPSELCSLYLDKELRKEGIGPFLSLTRLAFIGKEPLRFTPQVIARIRGYINEENTTPYWEHLGRLFLDIPFIELMRLIEKSTDFIPDILPKHPIYIEMLPKIVKNMIGKVHPRSRPALKFLKQEGFAFNNQIDLFDAGPTVVADTGKIGAVKRVCARHVQSIEDLDTVHNQFIICKGSGNDFRATLGCIERFREQREDTVIDRQSASLLNVKPGDLIYTTPAHKRVSK